MAGHLMQVAHDGDGGRPATGTLALEPDRRPAVEFWDIAEPSAATPAKTKWPIVLLADPASFHWRLVGDALLHETEMRDHPLTPMSDSNLVRVLQR
jgi:hypothetical protein